MAETACSTSQPPFASTRIRPCGPMRGADRLDPGQVVRECLAPLRDLDLGRPASGARRDDRGAVPGSTAGIVQFTGTRYGPAPGTAWSPPRWRPPARAGRRGVVVPERAELAHAGRTLEAASPPRRDPAERSVIVIDRAATTTSRQRAARRTRSSDRAPPPVPRTSACRSVLPRLQRRQARRRAEPRAAPTSAGAPRRRGPGPRVVSDRAGTRRRPRMRPRGSPTPGRAGRPRRRPGMPSDALAAGPRPPAATRSTPPGLTTSSDRPTTTSRPSSSNRPRSPRAEPALAEGPRRSAPGHRGIRRTAPAR